MRILLAKKTKCLKLKLKFGTLKIAKKNLQKQPDTSRDSDTHMVIFEELKKDILWNL